MKIAIGADHGGYELKESLIKKLQTDGYQVLDVGTHSTESTDFPTYSKKVTNAIQNKEADLGILVCGTGIGMSIAANKEKGIRASLVSDVFSAQATRQHNNSNVLCLGARVIGVALAEEILNAWLNSEFESGRHQKRLEMLKD